MITLNSYKKALSSHGVTEGNIRKNKTDFIVNNSFTRDPNYKKVYILTKDGWKFEDAKYQFHVAQSIAKDAIDYYLQFRPSVHYPIGSYVIVPDDTSPDINLSDSELRNPFDQPVENRTQWWIIVGRDHANAYVRYNILQCNWNFQWIWDNHVQSCFGCARNANSYTSGRWNDNISSSLDDLNGAWIPDTYYVYGDKCKELGISDTRTIMHEQRFMLTNNILDPKVYQVTKVLELFPQGIIKLSLKQDEVNLHRDNIDLRICDYYTNTGDLNHTHESYDIPDNDLIGVVSQMIINQDNELVKSDTLSTLLSRGVSTYYNVEFSMPDIIPNWELSLVDENGEFTEEDHKYYCGLIKVSQYNDNTVCIKPGKAKSLVGKKFILSIVDHSGFYHSSIELEVS